MYFRRRIQGKFSRSVDVAALEPGDCLQVRTSNSRYEFWLEFPALAIGVGLGGRLASPTRVRIIPEGTASKDTRARPLTIGERAQIEVLGPDGRPIRRFLTSQVSSLSVRSAREEAA